MDSLKGTLPKCVNSTIVEIRHFTLPFFKRTDKNPFFLNLLLIFFVTVNFWSQSILPPQDLYSVKNCSIYLTFEGTKTRGFHPQTLKSEPPCTAQENCTTYTHYGFTHKLQNKNHPVQHYSPIAFTWFEQTIQNFIRDVFFVWFFLLNFFFILIHVLLGQLETW